MNDWTITDADRRADRENRARERAIRASITYCESCGDPLPIGTPYSECRSCAQAAAYDQLRREYGSDLDTYR